MRLILLHPEVAGRSCDECQQWLFDDKADKFATKPFERKGHRIPRPAASKPLCFACPKQPADVPDNDRSPDTAVEVAPPVWEAWQFFQECRAVGQFPDDPLVRKAAAICAAAEKTADLLIQARLAGAKV